MGGSKNKSPAQKDKSQKKVADPKKSKKSKFFRVSWFIFLVSCIIFFLESEFVGDGTVPMKIPSVLKNQPRLAWGAGVQAIGSRSPLVSHPEKISQNIRNLLTRLRNGTNFAC